MNKSNPIEKQAEGRKKQGRERGGGREGGREGERKGREGKFLKRESTNGS